MLVYGPFSDSADEGVNDGGRGDGIYPAYSRTKMMLTIEKPPLSIVSL